MQKVIPLFLCLLSACDPQSQETPTHCTEDAQALKARKRRALEARNQVESQKGSAQDQDRNSSIYKINW